MLNRFASARRGAHEHDYVETADYAEAFLHEVMRLVRVREARPAIAPTGAATEAPLAAKTCNTGEADEAVVIRTTQVGGVWHVTRGGAFYGDYLTAVSARDAATNAARDIADLDGRAELIAGVAPARSHHYGEGQTQRTITQDEQDRLARSRHPAQ